MTQNIIKLAPLALLFSLPVNASGLFLQEAVYANQGTAGAGDGVYTESAAAMWVNPAIMSFMGENKTTVNGLAFDLGVDFYDVDGVSGGGSNNYLGSVAAFHVVQLTDDLHFGVGLGTAGGSGLDYSANWAGQLQLEDINLLTLQVNPALSYRINDQWSVGAGLQINYAVLDGRMANTEIESASDWTMGYNAGVVYQPSEQLMVGLSYRSKLEHDFQGNLNSDIRLDNLQLTDFSMDSSLVALVDLSASYQVTPQLALLTTIQWHQWSDWDSSPITFNGSLLGQDHSFDLSQDRDWDDVWHYGVGLDYAINKDWNLKLGFSYETSPQDDPYLQTPDIPVGVQKRYSVGVSTHIGDSKLDVFYEYADLGNVEIRQDGLIPGVDPTGNLLNGYFDSSIHFVGVAVTF
ncbi:outer membrane protein transport protein [Shewanella sp. 1_MG-2023]|uniref:Outer membrane protein transport protein n=1 Tax=Shewanella electrodiphila TaxID=934143 RepID=A0ABT0KR26_9GAMM|nr:MULTISPECIES: outer membrane protein transport protein [Shewanella]MCC4834887.1 outer membrane protein transport protein [Shewanella sp. 10N.7]MCL1046307.1 outer membrane protein transport protein [Shewanella electrodiphila]MDO6613326.1 outer membrane protein transport protein [Shewanella sp. 7_MG-2023]MDO6773262.1 outer membrane protein transport protein [Shewanella sp. 2_MG-2023]MDO6796174.1 outer membrane protein transport protein [Shewanella sp. 1_MG-2023]